VFYGRSCCAPCLASFARNDDASHRLLLALPVLQSENRNKLFLQLAFCSAVRGREREGFSAHIEGEREDEDAFAVNVRLSSDSSLDDLFH